MSCGLEAAMRFRCASVPVRLMTDGRYGAALREGSARYIKTSGIAGAGHEAQMSQVEE